MRTAPGALKIVCQMRVQPSRYRPTCAAFVCLSLFAAVPGASARPDYARQAWDILPPGEAGSFPPGPHSTDQIGMYDGLTPLFGHVSAAAIPKDFKREPLDPRGSTRTEHTPRAGLRILRDSFDVPFIYGRTRASVEWVAAEDRGLLINRLRNVARLAALDAPGLQPGQLAASGADFVPSPATERFLNQNPVLRKLGPRGRQTI